jgi:hypothetical protein
MSECIEVFTRQMKVTVREQTATSWAQCVEMMSRGDVSGSRTYCVAAMSCGGAACR